MTAVIALSLLSLFSNATNSANLDGKALSFFQNERALVNLKNRQVHDNERNSTCFNSAWKIYKTFIFGRDLFVFFKFTFF